MNASEAAAALGRIQTEKKQASNARNLAKGRESLKDPEVQAEANRKRAEKQRERWARVHAEQEAAGPAAAAPARKLGRPRKQAEETSVQDAPKRTVGRPRKADAQTPVQTQTSAHTGTQEAEA